MKFYEHVKNSVETVETKTNSNTVDFVTFRKRKKLRSKPFIHNKIASLVSALQNEVENWRFNVSSSSLNAHQRYVRSEVS